MGWGALLPCPYAKDSLRFIRCRSFPRLGIFSEFLEITLFTGLGAKKKALPLDLKVVAETFLELLQTNRRNIAPGSQIIRINDDFK